MTFFVGIAAKKGGRDTVGWAAAGVASWGVRLLSISQRGPLTGPCERWAVTAVGVVEGWADLSQILVETYSPGLY